MTAPDKTTIIKQTKKWITEVVVGCGFCPFAAKELKRDSIHYEVLENASSATALNAFASILQQLDNDDKIETVLLILPGSFLSFDSYLKLIEMAEDLLVMEHYEGVYQAASFHPNYLFAGSNDKDATNYTNRSPYPMIHILREASVSKAVDSFPDVDDIPNRNISFANEKGLIYMQKLLAACTNGS